MVFMKTLTGFICLYGTEKPAVSANGLPSVRECNYTHVKQENETSGPMQSQL